MGISTTGEATSMEVTAAVVFYCLCSGSMLLVNKLAVHHMPLPGLVTSCQFSTCSAFVFACKLGGCLHMDDFVWSKAKYFIVYVISFTIGTYTNIKVLSMANVETIIGTRTRLPTTTFVPTMAHYHGYSHTLSPPFSGLDAQCSARALRSLSPSWTIFSTIAQPPHCAHAFRCCSSPLVP
uniref:Sugar phosphate transporter domain-containing protein n=1 Tax=Haptolina brevifila TaxID=156173 RepID=A0A7S2G6D3_9EUKA|mmetsp:Transcript_28838/g.58026  ORF Transcript_28838/g.58026 Transcript_28838/m.58026 type:complete len:180 (+) Transcript_28838:1-540(+)